MTHKCCSSADIGFIEENILENILETILENILDKNIGFGERLALEAKKSFHSSFLSWEAFLSSL